jgi:hypothetical protein
VPFPSSQMRREPSWATATPTGRAQTEESFASPAAFPEMRSSRATRAANGATFSMANGAASGRDDHAQHLVDRLVAVRKEHEAELTDDDVERPMAPRPRKGLAPPAD